MRRLGAGIALAAGVLIAALFLLSVHRGKDVQAHILQIECFEDLEALSRRTERSEGAFEGTVHLMCDIRAERPLVPIGSAERPFNGTFEGNGHAIIDLTVSHDREFAGLFGYIGSKGSVRNLTLRNAHVSGTNYTGGIAGYCAGIIENCRMEGGAVSGTSRLPYGTATGGLAGMSCGMLLDCVNDGTGVEGQRRVGGVVGGQYGGKIERCANTGTVRGYDTGDAMVGGVAGSMQGGGKMNGCINMGNVSARNGTWTGGVTGGLIGGGMVQCISLGQVRGRQAGGTIGYAAKGAQVMCCVYVGYLYPSVGEGRQDGTFILPADRKKMGRAYELLRPLIEQKEHYGVSAAMLPD